MTYTLPTGSTFNFSDINLTAHAGTVGYAGGFGAARSDNASGIFNPNSSGSPVANIGADFSDRGASNSTDNIFYMNTVDGTHIPATTPAPIYWGS